MALKPLRNPIEYDTTKRCNDVAVAGHFLCHSTAGSGIGIGDSGGYVTLSSNPSGSLPAGLLLVDIVSVDTTKFHKNSHTDEAVVGDVIPLGVKGYWVTDRVIGSPTNGQAAYLSLTGHVTPTVSATGGTAATPLVGRFNGVKDADGFIRVDVNLPVV